MKLQKKKETAGKAVSFRPRAQGLEELLFKAASFRILLHAHDTHVL